MTQPIHQVQSFPQRLPSITENPMGALSSCPVEILLSIFDYLNDKDLRNVSLVNWACNQFIENRTSWAKSWREYKRLFQIFHRALIEGNITPKPPIAAINAFSTPFTPTHTFRISDNSTICISDNLQSCGRLDRSQEGTSSSPLLPFIFSLFDLSLPLSDIYHSEMSQEGNDLHITLLINTHRGQEPYSSHFLTYEIDKAKASSCYIGNLKSYYRSQSAGILIKNIERVVQQNGIFEAKEKLNFYEHPRKKFYQVCGVFGDWVMIVTSPSKHPHSHPTVHFYDKENLREEFYYKLPPSTTVSNPPYIRDNTCVNAKLKCPYFPQS